MNYAYFDEDSDYMNALYNIEKLKVNFYDEKFNIDTIIRDNEHYEPTLYSFLEYIFLRHPFSDKDHFIDIGCGKGRTLIMAAEFGCKNITGCELDFDRYQVLLRNIEQYKKKTCSNTKFNLFNEDAITLELDMSLNRFYFYDPFDLKTFIIVTRRILKSLIENPREIMIFLCSPKPSVITYLDRQREFKRIEMVELPRYPLFAVYTNTLKLP